MSILRFSPFDTDTAEGRSKERYRRAFLTTFTATLARVLGIFTGLAWIRLSLSYLNKESYGLWMAVGSIVNWGNLADLGLARGMQNHLSEANGRDDRELGGRYVSTGLSALAAIAVALGVVVTPLVFLIPWAHLLGVQDPALADETRWVVAAVAVCFLIDLPLSLVPTIYAAYQRGYVAALFSMATSLVSLGSLLVATKMHLSLPSLILVTSGAGIVVTIVNFGSAIRQMPWLRPRLRFVSRETLRALAGTSVALFVFQIGALLINETQSFIIARRIGLSSVTEWSVFMRVYMLPAILIQMIDAPLIPAFREAHIRGEHEWLRTAFFRMTVIKVGVGIVAVALYIAFGNLATGIVAGQNIAFSRDMWLGSGFCLLVVVWNSSFNDLMIAVDRLRPLVITVFCNGLVTPVLSYWLAPRFNLVGVLVATQMFSFAVSGWLLPVLCRDLLRKRAPEPVAPSEPGPPLPMHGEQSS